MKINQIIKEYQAPALDAVDATDTYAPPSKGFAIRVLGPIGNRGQQVGTPAATLWYGLTAVFPRDYPPADYQSVGQQMASPQARVLNAIRRQGSAVVKSGISSRDMAETLANKLASYGPPPPPDETVGPIPMSQIEIISQDLEEDITQDTDVTEGIEEDPLELSSDYALYIADAGRKMMTQLTNLAKKIQTDSTAAQNAKRWNLGDYMHQHYKTDDMNAINQVFEEYGVGGLFDQNLYELLANWSSQGSEYVTTWKQYSSDVVMNSNRKPGAQSVHEQGVAEGDAPIDHDWYRKQQERQTRAKQKQQGVTENYPKHQDLSGVSTDKLKAYLARQSQQSVPGEGGQVKRVQAELQRRSQGVAEAEAPLKHHTARVSYHKEGDPHRRYEAIFKTTHNGGKEETEKRAKAAFSAKKKIVYDIVHEQGVAEGGEGSGRHTPGAWDTTPGKIGRVEKTAQGIRHHADPGRYGGTEDEPELDTLNKSSVSSMDKALGIKWDRESKKYFSPLKVDETNNEKIGGRHDADDFDNMVARLKKLAGAGPMRTVYDPDRRVYKNVPHAVQPAQQPKNAPR
jgi:hypothetical protein